MCSGRVLSIEGAAPPSRASPRRSVRAGPTSRTWASDPQAARMRRLRRWPELSRRRARRRRPQAAPPPARRSARRSLATSLPTAEARAGRGLPRRRRRAAAPRAASAAGATCSGAVSAGQKGCPRTSGADRPESGGEAVRGRRRSASHQSCSSAVARGNTDGCEPHHPPPAAAARHAAPFAAESASSDAFERPPPELPPCAWAVADTQPQVVTNLPPRSTSSPPRHAPQRRSAPA